MTQFVFGVVFGVVIGGLLFWKVGIAVERFRRARYDFHATRRGIKTLLEMMANRAWEAAKGVAAAAFAIGLLAAMWRYSR